MIPLRFLSKREISPLDTPKEKRKAWTSKRESRRLNTPENGVFGNFGATELDF
jgi:hypothetical protein